MSFFGGFAQGLSDSKRMREAQSMRELQNKLIKLQTQQYETNLKMRQSQRESAEGLIKQMRGSSPSNLISDIYQPFRPPMLAPDPNAPGATDLDAMKGQTLGEVLNTTLGQQMFLGMSPEMQRGMLGLSKFRSEEKQREAGQAWLDRQGSNGSMSTTIDPSTGALRHTFNPRTVTRETRSEDGRYWETFDQSGKLMGRRRAAPEWTWQEVVLARDKAGNPTRTAKVRVDKHTGDFHPDDLGRMGGAQAGGAPRQPSVGEETTDPYAETIVRLDDELGKAQRELTSAAKELREAFVAARKSPKAMLGRLSAAKARYDAARAAFGIAVAARKNIRGEPSDFLTEKFLSQVPTAAGVMTRQQFNMPALEAAIKGVVGETKTDNEGGGERKRNRRYNPATGKLE